MLTPRQLQRLPEPALAIFAALDDDLKAVSARAIARGETNRAKVRDDLAATSASYKARINGVVRDSVRGAAKQSLTTDEAIYEKARIAGLIGPYTPIEDAAYVSDIIKRGVLSTQTMGNIVRTKAEQAAFQGFTDALDTATLRLVTNQGAPAQVIRDAVKQIATTTTKVSYVQANGARINESIYSATRRAVLTGANQATLRIQEKRLIEVGARYVETSAHMGARPEHAVWQGQVFEYPGEFIAETGYGTGEGLGGWNCAHSFFPYFPDIMEPTDWGIDSEENARAYELSQEQRKAERNIRAYKSRTNVYREAERASTGETAAALKAEKDKSTDLTRKWQRERDRVVSQRNGRARTDREVATVR